MVTSGPGPKLTEQPIKVRVGNASLWLPHPAHFAFHKLIVFQRRPQQAKAEKDRKAAVVVLKALLAKGEAAIIRQTFKALIPKWQKKIIRNLKETGEPAIMQALG